MNVRAQQVRELAVGFGFNLVGLTPAVPSPHLDAYLKWIEAGLHGSLGYMARPDRVARRCDLNEVLPGARSLVMVGLDYHVMFPQDVLGDPSRGRISNYAWQADYHDIMMPRLEALAAALHAEAGGNVACRVYVDTGAILERSHAMQAGFGFFGKNTMLIHPRRGSQFFLGEIITALEFDEYDAPYPAPQQGGVDCGSCERCLTMCPTDAFAGPRILDAGRCISALTIEHKGSIPVDLRSRMGNWVYGCDDCQDVCPFNRFAVSSGERRFYPRHPDDVAPPLLDLLALTPEQFRQRFAGSPILRIKRERLVRNACVAAGNWGDAAAVPLLETLKDDPSALVQEHALWALEKISASAS